jgi:formylglycine-generating enzyme required for sulfatase activity
VIRGSWDDAQKFCTWLSKKEGKLYRLPTDQEWSLAVGIGRDEKWKSDTTPATVFKDQSEFPWGKEWPPPKGAGNYSDMSRRAKAPGDNKPWLEGYDDTFPTTAPVMSFAPNEVGLYDMGGNAWEWVEDWYSGERTERVLRGGSWHYGERGSLLSSIRHRSAPAVGNDRVGFRVVLEMSASGR